MKTHKRNSMQQLFKCLHDAPEDLEPEAERVFKATFVAEYSKDKDYLLRNEYRLLFNFMLDHLYDSGKEQQPRDTMFFIEFLLQNHIYELLESELAREWQLAEEQDDLEALLKLSDLRIRYHLKGRPQTQFNAIETAKLSAQRIELLQKIALREIRKEEIRLKFNERIISAYQPLSDPSQALHSIDLGELEKDDRYAQYLSQRARINGAMGEEKIHLLEQVLQDESLIRKYEPDADVALCRFWANLAQEYYIANHFAEAIIYYRKTEAFFAVLPKEVQETLVLNHILTLMRNDEFEYAKQLAETHTDLMLNSRLLASRSPFLIAMLHLYTGNSDEAEKFVALECKKEGSEFYFFMRLVLSAIFYQKGKFDLAEREISNLEQAVNYEMNRDQTVQTRISKQIVSSFKRFYLHIQEKEGKKRDRSLSDLKLGLSESSDTTNDRSPSSILTHWMMREIDGILLKLTGS